MPPLVPSESGRKVSVTLSPALRGRNCAQSSSFMIGKGADRPHSVRLTLSSKVYGVVDFKGIVIERDGTVIAEQRRSRRWHHNMLLPRAHRYDQVTPLIQGPEHFICDICVERNGPVTLRTRRGRLPTFSLGARNCGWCDGTVNYLLTLRDSVGPLGKYLEALYVTRRPAGYQACF
jgi:ClpX C4-type zinc finger